MIVPTGITFHLLSHLNEPRSSYDHESFHGYACYLKEDTDRINEYNWKCKLFDDFREATKFALQGRTGTHKMPFKFVRVSFWVPPAFHRRILRHELALPVHKLFPDEN